MAYLINVATDNSSEPPKRWDPPEDLLELGQELLLDLIDLFKSNTDACLTQIAALLSRNDYPGVKAQAHKIKGGASQIGALEMSAACAEVEAAAADPARSGLVDALKRLEAEYLEVSAEMRILADGVRISA